MEYHVRRQWVRSAIHEELQQGEDSTWRPILCPIRIARPKVFQHLQYSQRPTYEWDTRRDESAYRSVWQTASKKKH